jgi:hypothetical protein
MGASGQDSRAERGREGTPRLASCPLPLFSLKLFFLQREKGIDNENRVVVQGFYSRQERRRRSSELTWKLLWAFFSGCSRKAKKKRGGRGSGSCLPFRVPKKNLFLVQRDNLIPRGKRG